MSEELKACGNEFCRSTNVIIDSYDVDDYNIKFFGTCEICNCCGEEKHTEAEAIAAWNHRPIKDALKARIKELEAWQKEAVIYLNKFSFVDGKETGWNLEDNEAIELETLIEQAEEHGE